MATDDDHHWPYPVGFCPTCGRGFEEHAQLIGHMFDRRHWRAIPAPDPAGAKKLKDAIEAAEARRRAERGGP
jgi:hypothetical protein